MGLVEEKGHFEFSESAIDGCNWLMYNGRKVNLHNVGLDINSSYKIGEVLFRHPTSGASWQLYCTLMLCTSLDTVWAEIIWKLWDPWSDHYQSQVSWQEFKMTSQTFNDEWTFEYVQIGKSFTVNVVTDSGHNASYWTSPEKLKKDTMQGTLPPFM